jgi:N-acetylglucosaminyldiphosphoundecaprenol N-acetyl-beta-D-mannosaminyltransferase
LNENFLMELVNVLGVNVSPVPFTGVLAMIDSWIQAGTKKYCCCAPVSSVMAAQGDKKAMAAINGAGLVVPDGMPIVWIVQLAGFANQDRVYGPDLLLSICALSEKRGYSHFFYGGEPGIAERLVGNLKQQFPCLKVAGTYCPPFRPLTAEEDRAIIDMINHNSPDIVWVGLGSPKQDLWMAEHYEKLDAKVCIGVGAAFDFHSGRIKQAPRWMQQTGLEWLHRLWQEPRRLWRRYLIGSPAFVFLIALQLLGLRKYE